MSTHNENAAIGILEAVETLASIAEMGPASEVAMPQNHDIILLGKKVSYQTSHWLLPKDPEAMLSMIRETFQTVLHYLQNVYKDTSAHMNGETLDGIKTIMVLAGEAGKKLEHYTSFFQETNLGSLDNLKEYQQLQEFYHRKIEHIVDESQMTQWIFALTQQPALAGTETHRIFVDLDSVKRDLEYELFFLRKEDGSHFFNPRLIRNMKLLCDFARPLGGTRGEDPLAGLSRWQDEIAQTAATSLFKVSRNEMAPFFHELAGAKDRELISVLNKAIMAILLSENENNLLIHDPIKSCHEYFADFETFLHQALHVDEYQRALLYGKGSVALTLTHDFCYALFTSLHIYQGLLPHFEELWREARTLNGKHTISEFHAMPWVDRLTADYSTLTQLLKRHPYGPLVKMLELLQEDHHHFDPLSQGNLPNHWYNLGYDNNTVSFLHLPSPTTQEVIHQADVIDEFKGFLWAYRHDNKHHLLFNLQDRTMWREHARCEALEDLPNHPDFGKCLTVVTLPKSTSFYRQDAPYDQQSQTQVFIAQLLEHIGDESSGFFFPPKIQEVITHDFLEKLATTIHHFFFSDRNVLMREDRKEFIELTYLFLELKIIEIIKPNSCSFTCKDGIDTGAAANALLFSLFKLLQNEKLSTLDYEQLQLMLFGPAILVRERPILTERFQRFAGALKYLDLVRTHIGEEAFRKEMLKNFSPFFQNGILQGEVLLP